MNPERGNGTPKAKIVAGLAVLATTLAIAIAETVGAGIGTAAIGLFKGDAELVSSSAIEQVYECGTDLFVAQPMARRVLSAPPEASPDWTAFQQTTNAVVAGQSEVEVSIQGESSRTITLTRIAFDVERRKRPRGATFRNPCGGPAYGRTVVVDLDRRPPAIVASTEDPEGLPGAPDETGAYRPIRFPWAVSITDPLLLRIYARTAKCLCIWRAEIVWRSGEHSGTLRIDNGGLGYSVAGTDGVPRYSNGGPSEGWGRYSTQPRR